MHLRLNRDITKKVLLCLLTFSGYFFGISVFIHSQALFLAKAGPEQLPLAMVLVATSVIVYSLISSFIGSRLSAPLRFAIFTILISACYGGIYFLPENAFLQVLLFFVTSSFLIDFLDISVINVSSSLMTPLQVKNIMPLLTSFTSLGVITGSYFAVQIQKFSESLGLGILPALALLIVVLIALLTVRIFRKDLAIGKETVLTKQHFGKKMKGYFTNEAVVVATESRTSSPVRIPRDAQTLEHPQVKGLFPCGEGAGYAGGIVSAAMDGEKIAVMAAARIKTL